MMRLRRGVGALGLGVGLLVAPARLPAQEIYQAVVLDLGDLEGHVTGGRGRGDEQPRLLLRDGDGRVRAGGVAPISGGLASGGTTIPMLPGPLLEPRETEFAVALVRGGTELHRTEWRPIFPPK